MKNINFKKLILVLGIIIVLNLFFNYGIKTFYDEPKYENYCAAELTAKQYQTKEECESVWGLWQEREVSRANDPALVPLPTSEKEISGWCDATYSCRKTFDEANDFYKRNVFVILITAGVISIVAGFLIVQSEAVALGLSFGGLVSLLVGTTRYWSAMNDYLRFIILGIALAILVWIGIKKLKDSHENDGI